MTLNYVLNQDDFFRVVGELVVGGLELERGLQTRVSVVGRELGISFTPNYDRRLQRRPLARRERVLCPNILVRTPCSSTRTVHVKGTTGPVDDPFFYEIFVSVNTTYLTCFTQDSFVTHLGINGGPHNPTQVPSPDFTLPPTSNSRGLLLHGR